MKFASDLCNITKETIFAQLLDFANFQEFLSHNSKWFTLGKYEINFLIPFTSTQYLFNKIISGFLQMLCTELLFSLISLFGAR